MADFVLTQPSIPVDFAAEFVKQNYGKSVLLLPLDSERDQNFLAEDQGNGEKFVLKIANRQTNSQLLDLENQVMLHLSKRMEQGGIPLPIETADSSISQADPFISIFEYDGQKFLARLVRFLPGKVISEIKPRSDTLLQDLGRRLGQITNALVGFDHPAAHRNFHWDLDRAKQTIAEKGVTADFPCVDVFLKRYELNVLPHVPRLRKSVIHNDANDNNLLAMAGWPQRICGIIDFGDVVFSSTINELAIGIAYVMLDQPDPIWSAAEVVKSFDEEFELTDLELSVIFDLACMRLCTSVTMAAYQRSLQPENEYLFGDRLACPTSLEKVGRRSARVCEGIFSIGL